MYRIKKVFKGYPFAHRQHTHDGHCKFIHGHNWDFEIRLEADQLDENGFVYDFGKFGWLKKWLEEMFDHTLLLNEGDNLHGYLISNLVGDRDNAIAKIHVVESCSSEGLAKLVYERIAEQLSAEQLSVEGTNEDLRGVRIVSVTVHEDYKNSATYIG